MDLDKQDVVEKKIIERMSKIVQEIFNETGIFVRRFDAEWIDVSTHERDEKIVSQVYADMVYRRDR